MSYQTYKLTTEVEAVDIVTMKDMTAEEYQEYLENGLVWVDHHDVLRSRPAGYPLAATREQLSALIAHLQSLEGQVA